MVVAIASGKGGTGKTTVAVNLALTLSGDMPVQVVDCDVEEPNVHLFLRPAIEVSEEVTLPVPVVDKTLCNGCGRCGEVCAFNAVIAIDTQVMVFPELCHGCGGCTRFCPVGAISEEPRGIGIVECGRAGRIEFVQGRVNVGNPLVPPVVRAVKAKIDRARPKVVIVDAPPGTSCPVVASVKDSDFCVLVTEPTPFGLNDLTLAVDMARELDVPFGVVINRSGLGNKDVLAYCRCEKIPVLLEIAFDRRYAACYARGGRLVEEFPELREAFRGLWRRIGVLAKAG
ncbi:MAG: ATP-binding protein [Firmicutes bacterium]|nr:ATP-binding protein [Bacillota bacterium]MDH7496779.1 ATP-binding protein [Bacillota bacterium]